MVTGRKDVKSTPEDAAVEETVPEEVEEIEEADVVDPPKKKTSAEDRKAKRKSKEESAEKLADAKEGAQGVDDAEYDEEMYYDPDEYDEDIICDTTDHERLTETEQLIYDWDAKTDNLVKTQKRPRAYEGKDFFRITPPQRVALIDFWNKWTANFRGKNGGSYPDSAATTTWLTSNVYIKKPGGKKVKQKRFPFIKNKMNQDGIEEVIDRSDAIDQWIYNRSGRWDFKPVDKFVLLVQCMGGRFLKELAQPGAY